MVRIAIILTISFLFSGNPVKFDYSYLMQDGQSLVLKSMDGDISITGTGENNLRITQKLETDRDPSLFKKGSLKEYENSIIFSPQPGLSFTLRKSYEISVPENTPLMLNLFDGQLSIRNMSADISAAKINGNIFLENLTGKVKVSTGSGKLTIIDVDGEVEGNILDGNMVIKNTRGKVTLESGSGDISVSGFSGTLDLKTFAGNCVLTNVDGEKLEVVTRGGDISAISLVARSAIFSTMAGDVRLQNLDGFVSAETYGGEISGENLSGNIQLENYSGDINIQNIRGKLDIDAYAGSVTVSQFIPDSKMGMDSRVKVVSGDISLTYAGENIALDLKTHSGEITGNVAKVNRNFIHKSAYVPEKVDHRITITTINGDIVVNKGELK